MKSRVQAEPGRSGDPEKLGDRLADAIAQADRQYYRLVLLVGSSGSGKTAALQGAAEKFGCDIVNVNMELAKRMFDLPRAQRSRQVERLLKEIIATTPGNVVLLDNLEVLFDISLEAVPLRLLQGISRNRTIVATWNGTFRSSTLTYAEPGHPEFSQSKQPDAVIFDLQPQEQAEYQRT